jgi:hypothetical protein
MKTLIKLTTLLGLAASLSFADNWTGKLIDSACHDRQAAPGGGAAPAQPGQAPKAGGSSESCAPTATTTSFGIQTADGKVYKLDAGGNSKAMAAFKSDGAKSKDGNVSVSGDLQGTTIKVDSIDYR